MARGITSFHDYSKESGPWGMKYLCPYCNYYFIGQQRFPGNALARHSKSVGLIKKHIEELHPERLVGLTEVTSDTLSEQQIHDARRRGWIDQSLVDSAIPGPHNAWAGEIGLVAARDRIAKVINARKAK